MAKIIFEHLDVPRIGEISAYKETGGYQSAQKVLTQMKPQEVIEIVKQSGLRGRGGAGFLTGMKWGFVPKDPTLTKYLLCNGDESEPGTFKDRIIMEKMPHLNLEGIIIGSYAVGAHKSYIYVRGEYRESIESLTRAIEEARRENFIGRGIFGTDYDLEIYVFKGAGAYICGEETGLISSLEGYKGHPKLKPPFPAIEGFNRKPSVVNNTETLSSIPWIIRHGADAYKKFGTAKSPGTKLFCLSGPVNRPGTYELPLGTPLKQLIYDVGGGFQDNHKLKAVIPGGISAPVLTAAEAETLTLSYESCQELGTMLGSGGVIVISDKFCMADIMKTVTHFFWDESCGQCTPCREGTGWMNKIVESILDRRGRLDDLPLLLNISSNMMGGRTICALADAAAMPVNSFVKKFASDFEHHIREKRCHLHAA